MNQTKTEGLTKTGHDKIFVAQPMDIQISELNDKLSKLSEIEYEKEVKLEDVKKVMKEIVPTYIEPEKINKLKENEIKEKEQTTANVKDKVKVLINMNNQNNEQAVS